MNLRHCVGCRNRGLVKVAYRSGEPFDIAICVCAAGESWLARGEDAIRAHLALGADHQIACLEDFDGEDAVVSVPAGDAFIAAGQTAKKARL